MRNTLHREAFTGFKARLSLFFVVIFFYSTITACAMYISLNERGTYENSLELNAKNGAYVFIASDKNGQLVSSECTGVARMRGVLTVGAVYAERVLTLDRNPGESVRVVDAEPSAIAVLTGSNGVKGAVIGTSIGRQFGYGDGDKMQFGDGVSLVVESLFPSGPRSEGKTAWVYRSAGGVPDASKCIIESGAEASASVRSALPAMFPSAVSLEVSTLSANKEPEITARWESGLHNVVWLITASMFLIGAGASAFLRRKEAALYLMLGMPPARLYWLLTVQALATSYVALLLGVSWTLAMANNDVWAGALAWDYSLPVLCLLTGIVILAPSLANLVILVQNPARILRDRS